jgi:hypothetical protein
MGAEVQTKCTEFAADKKGARVLKGRGVKVAEPVNCHQTLLKTHWCR